MLFTAFWDLLRSLSVRRKKVSCLCVLFVPESVTWDFRGFLMHVNPLNYKAACFAPSLWHVSATRGDFEAAPQLGSLAANFSGWNIMCPCRDSCEAVLSEGNLQFVVKCWILPGGIGGIGGQPLVQGSFRQRALHASRQILQFRIWLADMRHAG